MKLFGLAMMLVVLTVVSGARSHAKSAEDDIRATISEWYAELGKRDRGRVWRLMAPGYIDATPHFTFPNNRSAAAAPRIYVSLAATALHFAYDIETIVIDPNFAKVRVWERGYFYAFAAKNTYERAASTLFVMERRAGDGQWFILAHQSKSVGIPPNKVTRPMPDMRSRYCETIDKSQDCSAE